MKPGPTEYEAGVQTAGCDVRSYVSKATARPKSERATKKEHVLLSKWPY
jgi:hypothetical protein